MAQASIYLNFPGNAEEALTFYRSIFGGDLHIARFNEMTPHEDMPPLPEYGATCFFAYHERGPRSNGERRS